MKKFIISSVLIISAIFTTYAFPLYTSCGIEVEITIDHPEELDAMDFIDAILEIDEYFCR
ncbi:MAG: hypothetical protein LBT43_02220 [Prevotella sp.]|jgi:hypothetical protein|nr:hypothetical protein [Prevotella sp.]